MTASVPSEKVLLHSACQEISRNFDTLSIARPHEAPPLGVEGGLDAVDVALDAATNRGNKSLSFTGAKRLDDFAAWATAQESGATLVLGGHSLWFRSFFQMYLPRKEEHECKKRKIVNCGAVAFDLQLRRGAGGAPAYRIDPDSIRVVYGGFQP